MSTRLRDDREEASCEASLTRSATQSLRLTDAARAAPTVDTGNPRELSEPVDFGEIACHVLTAVAANVDGVERLLSGRPGSWEARYVRETVLSTAGESDEELLRWRTEPLRLSLDVVGQFVDRAPFSAIVPVWCENDAPTTTRQFTGGCRRLPSSAVECRKLKTR